MAGSSSVFVQVALLCTLATCASAQSVDADRPGLLAATTVVGRGHAQVESGIQRSWATHPDDSATLLTVPSVLRLGVNDTWELQVGHTLVNSATQRIGTAVFSERGWGDLSLGVKGARAGAGWTPGAVVYGTFGVPSGSESFSSGRPLVSALLQLTWDFSPRISGGTLIGYARTAERNPVISTGTLGGSVGMALPADWAMYGEAGFLPDANGAATGTVGGGITKILRQRVQFDASLNRGLNAPTNVWSVGTGVSVLF